MGYSKNRPIIQFDNKELSSQLAQTEKQVNKANSVISSGGSFVDKIGELMNVRGMYARIINSQLLIGVGMSDDLRSVIEYRFVHDGDGLLLLRGVKSGEEDRTANVVPATLNGTFNQNSAPSTYTTTLNDSIDFEFTGSNLYFKRNIESRGGIWEFHLNDGQTRTVSCYNDETITGVETLIFEDLPHATYRGKAIFKGNDPINPPSVGTARGYVWYSATAEPFRHGKVRPIDSSTAKNIVASNSIPDFAIAAKPATATFGNVWVPNHSTVTGVSTSPSIKIVIDGRSVHGTVGTLPTSFTYREIEDFEITQKFIATHPTDNTEMWQHRVVHSVRKNNPYLSIMNNMIMLQDVLASRMYFGMLPSPQTSMTRLLLNNRKEYNPIPKDGSEDTFGLDVTSAMYAGIFELGNYHACAIDVSSLRGAINYGSDKQLEVSGLITFRTDNVSKVYFTAAENSVLNQGETYSCMHRIIGISGVRFPNEELSSL